METLRNYIRNNVLSTSEVAYLLNLSKPMITHLVKIGKLPCLKQTQNGLLFYRPDIEVYKNQKIKDENNKKIIMDLIGITQHSLNTYYTEKESFGEIIKVEIYSDELEALFEGRYKPENEDFGDHLYKLSIPLFVLINIKGEQLWLGGCTCGYSGTGPRGSVEILKDLGITDNLETLVGNSVVKLTKDNGVWSNPNISNGVSKEITNLKFKRNPVIHYFQKNNHLVLLPTVFSRFDIYPTDILEQFYAFLPNPEYIKIFPKEEQAFENGYFYNDYFAGHSIIYQVIIGDKSGKELWLPFYFCKNEMAKDNIHIKDLLEYCGFEYSDISKHEKILNWLNKTIFNKNEQPLFYSV